jgi:hypothetical protein
MALATHRNTHKDVLDLVFEWTEKIMCGDVATNRRSAQAAIQDEPDEDMLDYVFDHVESFTCRDKKDADGRLLAGEEYPGAEPSDFTRDNSLVEEGPPMETIRPVRQPRGQKQQRQQQQQQRSTQGPADQNQQQLAIVDNDLIDYLFEHVESFVCADPIEIPPQHTVPINSTKRNGVKKAAVGEKVPRMVEVTPSPKKGHAAKTTTKYPTASRGTKTRRRYYYDEENEVFEQEDEIQLFFRPETTKAR